MMPTLRRNLTCFLTYDHRRSISCSLSLRPFSSLPFSPAILDLLLHKHQFPPESASKVASVLNQAKDTQKADSILSFLKESGFSNAQVQMVAKCKPKILSSSLENVIKPKFRDFKELGFSSDDIVTIISRHPSVLERNFPATVIPSILMLRGLLGTNDAVAKLLRRSGWFLTCDLGRSMVPNFEFLKSCGVPLERILVLLFSYPRCLLVTPETFTKFVEKAEKLGADRNSNMFIHAIGVVSSHSGKNLELKLQAFRDCEFSDANIATMFQKTPQVLCLSVEKVKRVREVILATGKYDMSCIVNCPISLHYSIEKRYNPRFQILDILEKKNLIKSWPPLSSVSTTTDEKFYKQFTCPYLSEVGDGCKYIGYRVLQGPRGKIIH